MAYEQPIFTQSDVQVYSSKVVLSSKTYFISNITAVSTQRNLTMSRKSYPLRVRGLAFGIITAFPIMIIGAFAYPPLFFVGLLAGLVVYLIISYKKVDTIPESSTYSIVLETNSGRVVAYTTDDKDKSENIKNAIESAAASRR